MRQVTIILALIGSTALTLGLLVVAHVGMSAPSIPADHVEHDAALDLSAAMCAECHRDRPDRWTGRLNVQGIDAPLTAPQVIAAEVVPSPLVAQIALDRFVHAAPAAGDDQRRYVLPGADGGLASLGVWNDDGQQTGLPAGDPRIDCIDCHAFDGLLNRSGQSPQTPDFRADDFSQE